MNLNNWLLWLVIGVAVGWLIEFLIDYFFFGRRNRELESRLTEARAESDKLIWSQDEISTELAQQSAANKALQTKVDELETAATTSATNLQQVAARRGLLGALGNSLLREDRVGATRALTSIEEALAAKEPLEQTAQKLQNSIALLNNDLERAQTALRYQAAEFAANDASARHKLGLLTAAGGLLGTLGLAIRDGNEDSIHRELTAIEAELLRGPEVIRVEVAAARTGEVADPRPVEALNAQVDAATAKQKALQMEVDDLTARTLATFSRIGLVTTAGGVLGGLGAALANGDESAVLAGVKNITQRMRYSSPKMPTQPSQAQAQEGAL